MSRKTQNAQGYLLDTSVLLETLRPDPSPQVTAWMESVDQDRFYVSAITVGELMAALDQVNDPDRRTALMRWILTDMQSWFRGHILTLTPEVAAFWGSLAGRLDSRLSAIAGLQAAFALKHNLQLVTRDSIAAPHLNIVNPWVAEAA
ncbi:MAG: PIN domain-containing protein [Rhodospirillales bacterium]|nr:PIN domain-containing protein [Alphaproteobacteria bacterium]MCB9987080.1 PIN domain-containing protein [Rhodospirillales bacterium]USO08157.1 MAG: PIN domain-containing protein [Rhodospirillales bacterium]